VEIAQPVAASTSRRSGWASVFHNQEPIVIPRRRLATYGTHAFSVDGPVC